ncbi:MAG TPA: hypothetical protein VHZ24_02960, partial [Pirellulales bacterium]|nr:hypothetical protein [Pirellulales bacterium]
MSPSGYRKTTRWRSWLGLLVVALLADAARGAPLNGTQELTWDGDLAARMVDGIHTFLDRATAESVDRRARHWKRDYSLPEAYTKSVEGNRMRLGQAIGIHHDWRRYDFGPPMQRELGSIEYAGSEAAKIRHVRWGAFGDVEGDALVVDPLKEANEIWVWIPDADNSVNGAFVPNGIPTRQDGMIASAVHRSARLYLMPIINRSSTFSTLLDGQIKTDQPHREFIYRQAFEVGRHIIGYEVQKVSSLIDYAITGRRKDALPKITVIGSGEGGLIALYAAALDTRIDTTIVAGYFGPREQLWKEPIYRNVFGLLDEFGDAELASLVAPRTLVIDPSDYPNVDVPETNDQRPAQTPGSLGQVDRAAVNAELDRARTLTGPLATSTEMKILDREVWEHYGFNSFATPVPGVRTMHAHRTREYELRGELFYEKRPIQQLVDYTQKLVHDSPKRRTELFAKADRASRDPAKWAETTKDLRKYFYDEVIGRIEQPLLPPNVRTRQKYDTDKYTGYEMVLDVF